MSEFTTDAVSAVTSVKRDDPQLDIFAVHGPEGGVYTNWVMNRDPWNQWFRLVDGGFKDSFTLAPGSVVTPIRRGVFTTHEKHTEFVRGSEDYERGEEMGSARGVRPGDHTREWYEDVDHVQEDIFAVGRDGGVYTNWVVDHQLWNKWIRIFDPLIHDGFKAQAGSMVTAIKRDSEQEVIFVVGLDGGIYTNWIGGSGQWNPWSRLMNPDFQDGFKAAPGSPVTAVMRDEHQLDIFVVGGDGGVWQNWVVDRGSWNRWVRIVDPQFRDGFKVRVGSMVAAIKRDWEQEDIFVVGLDKKVYTNWIEGHGQWQPRWSQL